MSIPLFACTFLLLLTMGNYLNSASVNFELDPDWEELFGHLVPGPEDTESNLITLLKPPSRGKVSGQPGKHNQSKITDEHTEPPIPPMPPLLAMNSDDKNNLPSVGANSFGSMEGIAISQNRGISYGIYIVNSSYNSFNTVFGNGPIPTGTGTKGTADSKRN